MGDGWVDLHNTLKHVFMLLNRVGAGTMQIRSTDTIATSAQAFKEPSRETIEILVASNGYTTTRRS